MDRVIRFPVRLERAEEARSDSELWIWRKGFMNGDGRAFDGEIVSILK
jgi:hypothetical protein